MEKKEPIFIIGSGRSGTTIMAKCLGCHPDLLFIDEPRFINHLLLPAIDGKLNRKTFVEQLNIYSNGTGKEPMKFLRRLEEYYGEHLTHQNLSVIKQRVINGSLKIFDKRDSLVKPEQNELVRNFIDELTALTTDLLGGRQWLIKQPDLSEHLFWLNSVFPNARFVHVFRNPFDVLHSRVQRGFQPDFMSAMQVWYKRTRAIVEFQQYSKKVMTVLFEKFVENPVTILNDISNYAGLSRYSWTDTANQHVKYSSANIGRGQLKFTKSQIYQIKNAWRNISSYGDYGFNDDFHDDHTEWYSIASFKA